MSNAIVLNKINESRRDALVNYAIVNNTFGVDNIKNADDLYQYLLLDTKISNDVKTSNVAEAISSLQLYIERCIDGTEPDAAADKVAKHFSTDNFLHDWNIYNKRYSRWAGKEKLQYYAADYIDPTLRYNKTELFTEFEQSINQGKLTENAVTKSLKKYLLDYEKLSLLDVSVKYYASEIDTYFFIGKSASIPAKYYWRSHKKNQDNGQDWSEWKEIATSFDMSDVTNIIPSWINNRLQLACISIKKKTTNDKRSKTFNLNTIYNDMDNSWIEIDKKKTLETAYDEDLSSQVYYTSYENLLGAVQQNDANFLFNGAVIDGLPNNNNITVNGKISVLIDEEKISFTLNEAFHLDGNTSDLSIIIWSKSNDEYHTLKLKDTFSISHTDTFNIRIKDSNRTLNYHLVKTNVENGPTTETINTKAIHCSKLVKNLQASVSHLLNYDTQKKVMSLSAFTESDGMYLWELFFHIPLLASARFLTEQRFDEAERWLKFLFNSAGYRDSNGELQLDEEKVRYWNILPLQKDKAWDSTTVLATTDPDVIAMKDPMQYKLAVFMRTLDVLITRGDQSYRQLEHDTLVDAKMYYVQASQLLGQRPEIQLAYNWTNQTLKDTTENNFLPPYNEVLLAYWDKLEIRLYNLRHNLSLDGQPLHLPLFATPVDPKELQREHGAGNGISQSLNKIAAATSLYRFPLLLERAKSAVSSVMQFGNELQIALEKQDNEALTLLLQQQWVLQQTHDIQSANINILQSSRKATAVMKSGAEERFEHYKNLLVNGNSANEDQAIDLRISAATLHAASAILPPIAGALDSVPNIFGMADGGSRWGAIAQATGITMQVSADVLDKTAWVLDMKANFARRAEEWQLQKTQAEKDVAQLQEQIVGLDLQISMAEKQRDLAEMEQSHALAIYQMQTTRFSGKELYNWMVGRLSGLYYQLFDAAQPLCLMAKSALERDIDTKKTQHLFINSGWNDLYQGLLAGEDLMLSLQKLENIWLIEDQRALEVERTISLAEVYTSAKVDLLKNISDCVNGTNSGDIAAISIEKDILSTSIKINELALDNDYPTTMQLGKKRRIKQISVSLPALLGPYQDVQATLSYDGTYAGLANGCTAIAISRGMNDSGQFQLDFNDSKYLPFEGLDINDDGALKLRFPNATGKQKDLLQSLSDIILHIRYTIRS